MTTTTITEEQVLATLRGVLDPELGVNVVDLGLIYGVDIAERRVRVVMTLTTPSCPLSASITDAIEATLWQEIPDIAAVDVQLVWEPRWRPELMSDEARRQLGWR